MKEFKLINNEVEKKKYALLQVLTLNDDCDDFNYIYKDDGYFIFYFLRKYKTDHEDLENQTEIPKSALGWIYDTITKGFWRKPSEGGLPKNQHAVRKEFDGEDLIITRTMNAVYGEPGFALKNKSRQSYISKTSNQQVAITDSDLKDSVLDLFNQYRTDK